MEEKKKSNKKFLIIGISVILVVISIGLVIWLNNKTTNSKVNAPQLIEGMIPIKWNGSEWIETTTDDRDWYNYANKQWANVKLADGSMFVWIPRYAYKITQGYHENPSNGGKIEIQFLNGTSNITFNDKQIDNTNFNSQNDFVIHPAFKFGDEELQGIWVAKYEASKTNSTNTDIGNSKTISFKSNSLSTKDYDINGAMYYCRDMEKQNIYGWKQQIGTIINTGDIIDDSNNFDVHLTKNTEWSCISYLAQSKYGINKNISANTSQISGNGGITSTTTGNETGIYDMAGQNPEVVSAYFESSTSDYILKKYKNMVNFNDKYKDKYTAYSSDTYGDSLFETSAEIGGKKGWYDSETNFIYASHPFLMRSGILDSGNIYTFYPSSGEKGYYSFRATIITSEDILSEQENQEKKQLLQKEEIQNVKITNLNTLANSFNNYSKGYIDSMNTFSYTAEINDIDFVKIRNYYNSFNTDYQKFKTNISQYQELQEEMKDIILKTDEFLLEFDKATRQSNDVNTIIDYFESSSDKWQESYKLLYKMLYGKDLD